MPFAKPETAASDRERGELALSGARAKQSPDQPALPNTLKQPSATHAWLRQWGEMKIGCSVYPTYGKTGISKAGERRKKNKLTWTLLSPMVFVQSVPLRWLGHGSSDRVFFFKYTKRWNRLAFSVYITWFRLKNTASFSARASTYCVCVWVPLVSSCCLSHNTPLGLPTPCAHRTFATKLLPFPS